MLFMLSQRCCIFQPGRRLIKLSKPRGSISAEGLFSSPQPSNFLLMGDNPLMRLLAASAAADAAAANAAPAPPSLAAMRGSAGGPAASYDPLTGAYMSAATADGSAEATEQSAADWPAGGGEGQYTGGWLKGIDFGCSNEVAPGTLLCKMTVRRRSCCHDVHWFAAFGTLDSHAVRVRRRVTVSQLDVSPCQHAPRRHPDLVVLSSRVMHTFRIGA